MYQKTETNDVDLEEIIVLIEQDATDYLFQH